MDRTPLLKKAGMESGRTMPKLAIGDPKNHNEAVAKPCKETAGWKGDERQAEGGVSIQAQLLGGKP